MFLLEFHAIKKSSLEIVFLLCLLYSSPFPRFTLNISTLFLQYSLHFSTGWVLGSSVILLVWLILLVLFQFYFILQFILKLQHGFFFLKSSRYLLDFLPYLVLFLISFSLAVLCNRNLKLILCWHWLSLLQVYVCIPLNHLTQKSLVFFLMFLLLNPT